MLKSMLGLMASIMGAILSVIKWVLIPLGIAVLIFMAICFGWYLWMRFHDGLEFRRREGVVKEKKHGLLHKLFVQLPRRYMIDRQARNPDRFGAPGIVAYVGGMGTGKTACMVHDILEFKKQYPKLSVLTNFGFKGEDVSLSGWKEILTYENPCLDCAGVLCALDEAHIWFQAGKSYFPPELLQTICFSRKQTRRVMLSMQNFHRVDKKWREQVSEIRYPHTYLGCFTVVTVYDVKIGDDGLIADKKYRKMYCFVHDSALRSSYDTYRLVETLSKVDEWQAPAPEVNQNVVVVADAKKGRK